MSDLLLHPDDPCLVDKVNLQAFETLVVQALFDERLAAASIVQVPELQEPLSQLTQDLRYAYLDSLEDPCEYLNSLDVLDVPIDIQGFLQSSGGELEDWTFSEVYDPMVMDTRAYFDGGFASAIFQDVMLARAASGISVDLSYAERKELMREALRMSNAIVNGFAEGVFAPPGRTVTSQPEFREFLRNLTAFPKMRHDVLSTSQVTKDVYARLFSQMRDSAQGKLHEESRRKRIAYGVAGLASAVAIYALWTRRRVPSSPAPKRDLRLTEEQQEDYDRQWTRTDWPI